MSLFLKLFNTTAEYNAYTADTSNFILPNVSLIEENTSVCYNPYVPPYAGFCKLTLNNGETIELEGSGELTSATTKVYRTTVVSAEIGTQCTSIGNYAFYFCRSLTSVTIGNSVTSIGSSAFNGCSGLTSVTIGNSVTSIGDYAFSSCSGLTSVTIGNSVTSISYGAFDNCTSLTSVIIPNSVTRIDAATFQKCRSLTSVTIGNSVTSIGKGAFNGCSNLTSIVIPNSVTSIGDIAFSYCTSLRSIASNAMTAPTIQNSTFEYINTGGTLTVPQGSSGYNVWMGTGDYYLGKYNWTKKEQ